MEFESERASLMRALEAHNRRSDHLYEVIERATRELHVHKLARELAENEQLQGAVRSVADASRVESLASEDLRSSLAERGVAVPLELQLSVKRDEEGVTILATYGDPLFPAEFSWSSKNGFDSRIVNMWWRRAHPRGHPEEA